MRRGLAQEQSIAGYPAARSGLSSNTLAPSMLVGGRAAAALATQSRPDGIRASSQPLKSTPASSGSRALPCEVEQMVAMLDQRVTHATQAEEARLRMLSDQTQRLVEGLQAMRVAREIHEERRLKEIRMMENNLQLDLQSARQARKEIECRAEDLASSRLEELGNEMRRERLAHESVQEEYTREIGEEVRRLTAILEDQHKTRTEYGDRIVSSLEAEFGKVQQAILDEERQRYEAEGTMLRMVEDMCSGMRGEIQQERDEREAVQAKLLTLLEDTCHRIESSFSPNATPYATTLPLISSGTGRLV